MAETINLEFDKREVGICTFQVQKQVEQMLTSFKANIITKLNSLGDDDQMDGTHTDSGPTRYHIVGKWYNLDGKY